MALLSSPGQIREPSKKRESGQFTNHDACTRLSKFFRGSLCEKLARSHESRRVNSGGFVYQPEDAARSVFLLRHGLIKTVVTSRSGRELILHIYRPGEIFGELCFCGGKRREYAVAMEESEYVEIPLSSLMGHLENNREALAALLATICGRLSSAYDELSSLSFERTEQRLARTLLKLAEEFGEVSSQGKIIGHYIKQEELAAMIGAPREVVSSLLKQLREKHLIIYSRRGHLTVDTSALLAYSRPDSHKK